MHRHWLFFLWALAGTVAGLGCDSGGDATSSISDAGAGGGSGASDGTGAAGGSGAAGGTGAADGSGASDEGAGSGGDGAGCGALSATTVEVDGVTYYLVLQSVQPDPNAYRVQLNFADEAGATSCDGEPGSHASFVIVMTFMAKPEASGAYAYSDSRFPVADDTVNFYVSFFADRGNGRDDDNYLTPASGTLELNIDGGALTASIDAVTMTNEVDMADSFELSGELALDW